MQSIAAWLDEQGLSAYAAAFEANAIDLAVAARLSDADLRELGVASLGHRKRLLDAIDELRRHARSAPQAERRHVSVMFCDLVDSTALSARFDAEIMATLLKSYQRCCAAAIARFGGFVAQFLGDGIVAYFGYPSAEEHSAERAIRAALALVRDIAALDVGHEVHLQVRVGIATGEVVVGEVSASNAFERIAVVGETPNLAARLENAAAPNHVLIADATQRLVGGLFDFVEVDPLVLKGFHAPIKAWYVLNERVVEDRFAVRRARELTPLLGRDSELDQLVRAWRLAQAGKGNLVLIRGEPGIGKSRLLHELLEKASADPKVLIRWGGSPYSQNSPLGPVIAHLERAAAFVSHEPSERKRAKLDALVAAIPASGREEAAVLAALLSLPATPRDPAPDPDPMRQKRKTLQTIAALIARQAARQPVILVCEDMHWFDPTTLELIAALIERMAELPVLVLATCRTEFVPSWGERTYVATIALERLEPGISSRMIEQLAERTAQLAGEIVSRIVERADGVPLFIEELTKTVLESQADGVRGTDATLSIPATLRDSLVARLERLAPDKEIAQIGAAIGREFSLPLLEFVAAVSADTLRVTLERLVRSDLLRRRDSAAGSVYVFKHALIQDAAYGMLLHTRRRAIHRRIAQALETMFAGSVEYQPERLAEHWERADAPERALHYLQLAGQRAAGRSAAVEAESHFRRALRLIERLPQGEERDRMELEISVQQGGALRVIQGPAALETGKAFARARELCRDLGNNTLLVPALSGLYAYHFVRAENDAAGQTAQELMAFAQSSQERSFLMIAHRTMGMVLVHTGDPDEGRRHLEQSLALYNASVDGELASLYGTDHAQTASGFLAKALWLLGLPESAAAREAWASAHAKRVNHLFSTVQAAMFRITVRLFARDWRSAAALAQETRELARQHSMPFALSFTRFCLAACSCADRPDPRAIDEMHAAVKGWGPLNYRPLYLGLIAEAYGKAGNPGAGLDILAEARSVVEATNERCIEPELLRLLGELLLMKKPRDVEAAERAYREAIELAHRQKARSWELRAGMSLATLLGHLGRNAAGREVLAPVYGGFTEGLETRELRDARELLSQL